MLWVSLPDQRAGREVYWMSRMPDTHVTALASERPRGELHWVPSSYVRPIRRFVEAGALAWIRHLDRQEPSDYDWVTSLELCSLPTGQASAWRRRAHRAGKPVRQAVVTWENLPRQPLYRVPLYKQALDSCRDADLLLCMIDAARDHLLANGFDDERIRVVNPGVDVSLFTPAETPVAEPVVAFCSPLAPNKGIDRVLDAMAIVRRTIPDARLRVAGRGPLEGLVRQAAADPRCRTDYLGSVDAAGVADLLRSAAVFTTAPRPTWKWTEQLGLAYLEALATGLPIVTVRCGTNDEAVTPDNLLVADDAEELAEGLVMFLEDAGLRARVGRANRERAVTRYDLQQQCDRMGEAFADIERSRP